MTDERAGDSNESRSRGPLRREVPLVWTLPPEPDPIFYVNQAMSQFHEDGFIVSFGQIMPPLLLGTPEEIAEKAERVEYVESRTIVRIGLTRFQMGELVRLLTSKLEAYDGAKEAGA